MAFLKWLKGRVRYLQTHSAWSSHFETVTFNQTQKSFTMSSVLPSTLRWTAVVDGQFLTPTEYDALEQTPQDTEIVGFGLECHEEEKLCLGAEFWKFVEGDESRVKAIFLYDLDVRQLNLTRSTEVLGKGVTAGRKPSDYWFKILSACGRCDQDSFCFPENSPRLPKVKTKPLPSEVTLSDYYPYEFKLADFQVVEHNLEDGKEWHIGRVVSVSEGGDYVIPGEYIAVCIWYDYHFSEETRSAAVGIRRVISFADGAAVLGEPLSKGTLDW